MSVLLCNNIDNQAVIFMKFETEADKISKDYQKNRKDSCTHALTGGVGGKMMFVSSFIFYVFAYFQNLISEMS